jgi:hypothetical protein
MYSDSSRPSRREEPADAFRIGDFALGFYLHLLVYCIAVPSMTLIEPFEGSRWRPLWPLAGWGLGLFIHALGTFVLPHVRKAWRAARRRRAQENYRI